MCREKETHREFLEFYLREKQIVCYECNTICYIYTIINTIINSALCIYIYNTIINTVLYALLRTNIHSTIMV